MDALAQVGPASLRSSVVKVSHHGSTNGYCEGLWSAFAGNGHPLAVVTAFQRHHLPCPKALQHIQEFASRTITPYVSAIAFDEVLVPLAVQASPKSRLALANTFRARHLPEAGLEGGRCSLTFDANGRCVETSLSQSAAVIWDRGS